MAEVKYSWGGGKPPEWEVAGGASVKLAEYPGKNESGFSAVDKIDIKAALKRGKWELAKAIFVAGFSAISSLKALDSGHKGRKANATAPEGGKITDAIKGAIFKLEAEAKMADKFKFTNADGSTSFLGGLDPRVINPLAYKYTKFTFEVSFKWTILSFYKGSFTPFADDFYIAESFPIPGRGLPGRGWRRIPSPLPSPPGTTEPGGTLPGDSPVLGDPYRPKPPSLPPLPTIPPDDGSGGGGPGGGPGGGGPGGGGPGGGDPGGGDPGGGGPGGGGGSSGGNNQGTNRRPILHGLSNNTTNENVPVYTPIGVLNASDPDNDYPLTFRLVGGDTNAFILAGNQLLWAISPNYERKNNYTITVRVSDPDGLADEQTFAISVRDVNEKPKNLTLSNNSTPENVRRDTVIGQLNAEDEDEGDVLTYSIVGGDDAKNFSIDGDKLKWAIMPDYEKKKEHEVRIRVTDRRGLYTEEDFKILVTNLNEAPTKLELTNSRSRSGVPIGTVVGEFKWDDPEKKIGDRPTYALVNNAPDNNKFTISGNKLKWAIQPNYQVQSQYIIQAEVKDSGGLALRKMFIITVDRPSDAPPPPFRIQLSNKKIIENNIRGTVVGNITLQPPSTHGISVTVVDVKGPSSTTVQPPPPDAFAVVGSGTPTDPWRLVWNMSTPVDYEKAQNYAVQIRVRDNNTGTQYDEWVIIEVVDQDENNPPYMR